MKKMAALLCIMASLVLTTACSINITTPASLESSTVVSNPSSVSEFSAESSTESSTASSLETSVESSATSSVAESSAESSVTSIVSATESSALESSQTNEQSENSAAKIDGKIIDFDNMNFKINGKTYTMGKATLQDMINDKVPFKTSDLDTVNNNIKSKYQATFNVVLNDSGWSATLYFMNDSKSAKPATECSLQGVYLFVHQNEEQSVLSFNFPLSMTKEELFANAGEPTDKTEIATSGTYHYKKPSTQDYSNSAYDFSYSNNKLSSVSLSYLP